MHFNIYELLGLHNINMSCSYQSPEYECDTNSHKKRHVVINVAAWLVPRVNTRVRGTRTYEEVCTRNGNLGQLQKTN